MGCWIKQYKKGVAWFCNTVDKRVSPIMPMNEALVANMVADHYDFGWGSNPVDARLVKDWKTARKRAKETIKECEEEDITLRIQAFYEMDVFKPWE
jgi:hypothetical protein